MGSPAARTACKCACPVAAPILVYRSAGRPRPAPIGPAGALRHANNMATKAAAAATTRAHVATLASVGWSDASGRDAAAAAPRGSRRSLPSSCAHHAAARAVPCRATPPRARAIIAVICRAGGKKQQKRALHAPRPPAYVHADVNSNVHYTRLPTGQVAGRPRAGTSCVPAPSRRVLPRRITPPLPIDSYLR